VALWLLDVNLPNGLRRLLKELGQERETTAFRGWRDLGNGKLAETAYLEAFRSQWADAPIRPVPGQVAEWP
jgi:hypothetical protein